MDEVITKKVDSISFGIVSPALIRKIATTNITKPELYDADGYPVEKGLMDLGLGVIDPGLRCKVCGGRLRTCLGHFGYIQLARPILHILYIHQIHDLLRSFCKDCGRILLPQEKIEEWKKKASSIKMHGSTEELHDLAKEIVQHTKKVKKCPHCKAKCGGIKFEKPMSFHEEDRRLWPSEIRERFEKIPDSDLELMGYDAQNARPEWMVISQLLVPPITMRPSITLLTGERSEDDLTHKLSDIVRVNQRLLENINAGAPELIIEDLWDLLQYHITTYFDNEVSQVPPARHKTNKELKTLAQRLKGKEGRFRYNLGGKRVNFSARSVISPDSFIGIDEVGVPCSMAKELTVPERVTEWNINWLKGFVIRGNNTYPGATYIITSDGKRKKITDDTKEQILEELAPGWVVERHLMNGDIALFNRQPSLHRLSLMGHKVRLVSGKTFRIHPAVCLPYNADFDGDEMNLHIPQTEEARAEAKKILVLSRQVITPRYGLSIIGEVNDILVGLYILTKETTKLTKEDASELVLRSGFLDVELPKPEFRESGNEFWSGRQIFSLLLPEGMNFEAEGIKIENGKLIDGVIKSRHIAPEKGLLIHFVFQNYGPEQAKALIDAMSRLGLAVVRKIPYTLSFLDLDISKKAKEKIGKVLEDGELEVRKILKKLKNKEIVPLPAKTIKKTAEAMILSVLNGMRRPVGDIVEKEAVSENNLVLMANCGLVKLLNLALMSGFAGQMDLRGERIHKGYPGRTLPHFRKGDMGARARGFVRNGYVKGLDPLELFFNSIVGRDNLMDTAMRTPKSGYMQRRLINALQDLKVNYDGTIRDSGQKIVQFRYSGDNIDVSKSDGGGINA